jgi:hypothetical protein
MRHRFFISKQGRWLSGESHRIQIDFTLQKKAGLVQSRPAFRFSAKKDSVF